MVTEKTVAELIFIVGTDTEVGKTYTTKKNAKEKIENGKRVTILKPIETGRDTFEETKDGNYLGSDTDEYAKLTNENVENVNLYFFRRPISPHRAAELDFVKIVPERIIEFIDKKIYNSNYDIVIVEGAGGLLVPFTDDFTYLTLIENYREIGKVHIVAKNSLGTINHTLMTAKILKDSEILVEKIILNNIYHLSDTEFLSENRRIIEKITGLETQMVE